MNTNKNNKTVQVLSKYFMNYSARTLYFIVHKDKSVKPFANKNIG